MSNYTIFDSRYTETLLEPFAPGMAAHITPIRYEALTPDLFLLLFRTTGQDGTEHFFVSLEFDHIDGIEGARCTIEDWHGEVLRFWPLASSKAEEPELDDLRHVSREPYFAMLAEVAKPRGTGYWSDSILIMPGDNIADKIAGYTAKEQAAIRKTLQEILRHKTAAADDFLTSYQSKYSKTLVDDRNMTDMAVRLYVKPDGGIEYFYNFVDKAQ